MAKKITIIQPLLVNDKFITNFLEKANLFNEFFSKQHQSLQNNSTLPKHSTYHTENRLNDITFGNEKLLKIIQSLDANKARGYDGISIRMLKLSSLSIVKPLSIIFQNCLKSSTFPDDWKKGNIVPVHKKTVSNVSIIIVPCHCYIYVQKFLRRSYSIVFLIS